MFGPIAIWSHLFAAALYGALAIFQLRHWNGDPRNRPLVTAFAVVSVWAIFLALLDRFHFLGQLAESARNLSFLAFMYGIMREADASGSQRSVKAVFAAVAAAVGLQIAIGGVIAEYRNIPLAFAALVSARQLVGITISAGALILVHNLYGQASPGSRGPLRFPMLALAGMWVYDLHVYSVAYFTNGLAEELFGLRGILLIMLVPLFALGVRNTANWTVQLSRAATFQTISLVAILTYLIVMMTASRAIEVVGGDWGRALELGIILTMTAAAIVLVPSEKARAWLRIFIAKHLFEHRYDYRREWLRFTDTIGREGSDSPSLEERVAKAMADIGGTSAGLLLLADGQYRLAPSGCWHSRLSVPADGDGAQALLRAMEAKRFILDFGDVRDDGSIIIGDSRLTLPDWLSDLDDAWAGVPLIHGGRLVGLVLLEHPPVRRALDWEDFDLFRSAGIQAASYIAEARGQQALSDSRRFDEFNRRFAFIMHDLKNLVSQLSLVARNAERHAENPEFRADMIATLQSSVRKMNDLLVRLSPGAPRTADAPRVFSIAPIAEAVAAAMRRAHPVSVSGDPALEAKADPAGLEQVLGHLVQNAVDASPGGPPVEIRFYESGGDAAIEVVDHGHGMSDEFVRTRLYQPFASTKENGFGLGAYEARSLVDAMGGRLDVESVEGVGTRFTIFLSGVERNDAHFQERMRA